MYYRIGNDSQHTHNEWLDSLCGKVFDAARSKAATARAEPRCFVTQTRRGDEQAAAGPSLGPSLGGVARARKESSGQALSAERTPHGHGPRRGRRERCRWRGVHGCSVDPTGSGYSTGYSRPRASTVPRCTRQASGGASPVRFACPLGSVSGPAIVLRLSTTCYRNFLGGRM